MEVSDASTENSSTDTGETGLYIVLHKHVSNVHFFIHLNNVLKKRYKENIFLQLSSISILKKVSYLMTTNDYKDI